MPRSSARRARSKPASPRRRRRRILHVIPTLWSGAGDVLTHLCELQSEHDDLIVATSALRGTLADWPAYRRRLRAAGVRHVSIDTFARTSENLWRSVGQLRNLARAWQPDVVHTHAGVPTLAWALARPSQGTRHVAHMYSWGAGRPGWMNDMDLAGFRQADRVVCSAKGYERLLREGGVENRRLAYIPWGVRVDRIDAALAAHRPAPGIRIGFVGRVEPRKGQLDVIAAFAAVRRQLPDAELVLVGPDADTAYAARCRDDVTRRGLGAHVTWHGHVRDVAPLLVGWHAFVSLSSDEGQGLAVQEAMAARVPVVALAAPGLEDFVTDGRTGHVVGSRRPAEVARAIVATLREPRRSQRIVRAADRLVRDRYGWPRCAAAIDRLYRAR
jgi:glycosyltransferase involved in cell wall biosynthesis